MAIGVTLLYILAELLGPSTVFGPLAQFRIEFFVAVIAVLVSIPSIGESHVLRSRMSLAIGGIAFATMMSIVLTGWIGGVFYVGYGLLPAVLGFSLVAINCKTRRHLELVILTLFLGCVFDIANGMIALQGDLQSPYIYLQGIGEGAILPRIRGLEFVNDPNDFAQLMVSLLPLIFFFRRKDSSLRNMILVWPPLVVLLWGMYLTRSRGGAVALMITVIVAGRRKIGLVPAVIVGGLLFVGVLAAGFSGGRQVSSEGGADRIELWAIGLTLVKTHFFFGVGLYQFFNYAPNTAHNSVVICAAELGVVGLVFWVMFVFSAMRGGVLLGRDRANLNEPDEPPYGYGTVPARGRAGAMITDATAVSKELPWSLPKNLGGQRLKEAITPVRRPVLGSLSNFLPDEEKLPDEEIRRMARLLVYSLTGFLAAGWFLSRALALWLFIYCGMMHALARMAEENNIAPSRDRLPFLFRWSAFIAVVLLGIVSLIIRLSPP